MPCCKKALSQLLRSVLLLCLFASSAQAAGISVNKAEIRLGEDGYQLSASYDINLTFVVQQALARGIPLYFVSEYTLTRPRWYWLEEEIFISEQTTKLSYNVLARQYRISRGALFQNFVSLEDAMKMLTRQSSVVIPTEMIKEEEGYISGLIKKIKTESSFIAAVRLRLDTDQLPKLLQVNAMTGGDWTLDSRWYRWVIRPEELPKHNEEKTE